ncbi:MAG: PAS domain S-box protein [Planctomycetia bacterium]|nr:PAS domain S-box protein [Planctomycetia bacterium]
MNAQVLGVWWVRRAVFDRNPGSRLTDGLWFVVSGTLVATAVSALLGTALTQLLTPLTKCSFGEQFLIRWLAQSLSVLLIAPVGFAWWDWSWANRKTVSRWWEFVLFAVALIWLATWTFGRNIAANSLPIPDVVCVIPVCFWALVRWGTRGNSVCTLAISVMSIVAALHGRGPFIRDGGDVAYSTLILVMGNSIVFSATTLLTAALMDERREAVAALQKIDVRYQILFQNSPDAVLVIDMETEELLEFNNRFPEMLRCSGADLRGKTRSHFELDQMPSSLPLGSSVLSVTKVKTIDFDTQYRCGDGEIIDVNVTFSVIDFFGRQAQLMIARNVTARRKAEQQLRESEEKFRVLAEAIPSLVTIQRDQHPLYVNPAMIAVSGYSLEELQQASFLDLLRDSERDEVQRRLRRLPANAAKPWLREVSLFTKSGDERKVELSVTAISLEGRDAWLASAVDVTERRRREAELRQLNAELFHTARLRLLGEFVAGVAHDLKHPIGAIDLSTTAMVNRLNSGEVFSATMLHTEFEFVLSQAQKGIDRIRRLEDLSRRHETERRMIDLPPLVDDARRLVRLNRQWSDIPIKVETQSALPKVYVDRAEMTQVLLDLFRNALEAMEETPANERRIVVTIRKESSGFVRMTITDSGCGIPDTIQQKMFRAFNSTKSEGLGLGLSLCHTVVVERHRGKLTYEPALPRGTTFQIVLPTDRFPSA